MEYLKCINVESKTFFKKDFTYLFLERGEGRKRGRETSMCGCLSHTPYWDLACNPGMCPDLESNQWPFGSKPVLNPLSCTSQGSFDFLKFHAVNFDWPHYP